MVNAWQRSVLLVAPGGAKNPVSGVQLPYMHIQDQPHARTHRRRGQPSSCMMLYKLTEACKEDLGLLRPCPSELRSSTSTTRPRRPRPELLRRAPTTRPRRNDDRHEERRYDNRDHRHNRPKSTRIGKLYRHRPDFYQKISTLLIFIFNIIFIMMFLHNVLVMIILQTTFVHVYHLKYNIQLYLMQILDQSC